MKVKELIEILEKLNPELLVLVYRYPDLRTTDKEDQGFYSCEIGQSETRFIQVKSAGYLSEQVFKVCEDEKKKGSFIGISIEHYG